MAPFPASPSAPGADAKLRTYLVEDSATIRDNLVATLDELVGITPVGFASEEEESRHWLATRQACWDLAIVDIALKQGSGLGVLQACAHRNAEQKVVVLTNYATPAMRECCSALGADAVFDKSTDIDALIDYCRQLRAAHH